jgi:hypothetical protein
MSTRESLSSFYQKHLWIQYLLDTGNCWTQLMSWETVILLYYICDAFYSLNGLSWEYLYMYVNKFPPFLMILEINSSKAEFQNLNFLIFHPILMYFLSNDTGNCWTQLMSWETVILLYYICILETVICQTHCILDICHVLLYQM